MRITRPIIQATCVAIATAFMATGASAPAQAQAGAESGAAESVDVRFSWKLKGEYAHMFVAQEQGLFEAENLEVGLGEGAGSQAALAGILQGQDDVALLPGIFALTAISEGMPMKIIALYHPATPMSLISWPDNPVNKPKDLEGKSIATSVGETATSYLDVFCARNDIDCDKINRVQMASEARTPQFINKQVDVVSGYQTNDLPILRAKHDVDFSELDLAEHGLQLPGMALVTSDELLEEKPEALAGLLRATAKAVEATREDPAAAAELMLENWDTSIEAEVVVEQIEATMEAVPSYADKPIGWIDESALAEALEILESSGEIDEVRPLDSYYTNALLEMPPS